MLDAAMAWDFKNGDSYQVMRFWVEWAEKDQGPIDQSMIDALGKLLNEIWSDQKSALMAYFRLRAKSFEVIYNVLVTRLCRLVVF